MPEMTAPQINPESLNKISLAAATISSANPRENFLIFGT